VSTSFEVATNFKTNFTVNTWLSGVATDESAFVVTSFKANKKRTAIKLTDGGVKLLTVPNAGGSSVHSEVMSFEVLAALHNATLCQTEMEITYAGSSNITDYSVFTEGNVFGVSVTRAMKFGAGKFTSNDAFVLLKKKLKGVVESTKNVVGNKTWKKQILHVWYVLLARNPNLTSFFELSCFSLICWKYFGLTRDFQG